VKLTPGLVAEIEALPVPAGCEWAITAYGLVWQASVVLANGDESDPTLAQLAPVDDDDAGFTAWLVAADGTITGCGTGPTPAEAWSAANEAAA
jgi:hypothetical protein